MWNLFWTVIPSVVPILVIPNVSGNLSFLAPLHLDTFLPGDATGPCLPPWELKVGRQPFAAPSNKDTGPALSSGFGYSCLGFWEEGGTNAQAQLSAVVEAMVGLESRVTWQQQGVILAIPSLWHKTACVQPPSLLWFLSSPEFVFLSANSELLNSFPGHFSSA